MFALSGCDATVAEGQHNRSATTARPKVGHDAVVCSRSIRSPGHVSSALYAVREVRNCGPERRRAANLGDEGRRMAGEKHKTPDNITHPFPDYPFEKLFCRWMGGRPSRRSISSHVYRGGDKRGRERLFVFPGCESIRAILSRREKPGSFPPPLSLSFLSKLR